jgi:GST-like protein
MLGKLYDGSTEFLNVESYTHLMRWAKMIETTRPAARRGSMVNRVWGGPEKNPLYDSTPPLKERHSRGDFAAAAAK